MAYKFAVLEILEICLY